MGVAFLEKFVSPIDSLLDNGREGRVGSGWACLDILPAEVAPAPWEWPVDLISLHLQRLAQAKLGIILPDVRFRIFMNEETDNIHGTHFGTLEGAIKSATSIAPHIYKKK